MQIYAKNVIFSFVTQLPFAAQFIFITGWIGSQYHHRQLDIDFECNMGMLLHYSCSFSAVSLCIQAKRISIQSRNENILI